MNASSLTRFKYSLIRNNTDLFYGNMVNFIAAQATAEEVAGPDGGRPSTHVSTFSFTLDSDNDKYFSAIGDTTYGYLEGSITSSTGPWSNLHTDPILISGNQDDVVQVWLRFIAVNFTIGEDDNSSFSQVYRVRLLSKGAAAWGL